MELKFRVTEEKIPAFKFSQAMFLNQIIQFTSQEVFSILPSRSSIFLDKTMLITFNTTEIHLFGQIFAKNEQAN